jgi:hypothetical protein
MTQAEKRSLEAYPKSDFQRVENRRRGERSHYIKGYEQAVKDFTEKAVQWLEGNIHEYYQTCEFEQWFDEMYVDFREEVERWTSGN